MFDNAVVPGYVRLAIPPGNAQLWLWGKADDRWFGLIRWLEQTQDHRTAGHDYRGSLFCSGWAAAQVMEPVEREQYGAIPRISLPSERQFWPAYPPIAIWHPDDEHHYGLLDGQPLKPPKGIEWLADPSYPS